MIETLNDILFNIHRVGWVLLVIVFIIACILLAAGKRKGSFITHQIARFFYVVMILTGIFNLIYLAAGSDIFPWNDTAKGIIAIWLIYLMEVILGRKNRDELVGSVFTYYWLQWAIALFVVILIGYGIILDY
ncbi:DUF1516 family protein [Natribacillus halophilus]|uniref:Uncharacterized protein n=1 Tax=Natribacillus halophilus TaxID=549003 RepID=A0A1G8LS38_9BACI|nr:DUF1516 family protein [Natribacillus halophilus]SDI58010.1 Protein of unknown function [Natribacillus halophilus]